MIALQFLEENNFGDTRSGSLAGPMGLFIIVMLAIGTMLLIRNMNRRLRRLPADFDGPGGSGPVPQGDDAPEASAEPERSTHAD